MKIILLFYFILCSFCVKAQRAEGILSLGLNPLGLAESQMFLGPTASYKISKRYELWSEVGVVARNNFMPKEWTNMSGFRFVFQGRSYSAAKQNNFIAVEFRFKNFSSDDVRDFINESNGNILQAVPYRQNQKILGGAVLFGKRFYLNPSKRFFLEGTIGIGAKQRFTKAANAPTDYTFTKPIEGGPGLAIKYDDVGLPYVPLGVRIMWKL